MVTSNFAVVPDAQWSRRLLRRPLRVCRQVHPNGLKIKHRKVLLDQTVLDPHGKISIIL